MKLLPTPACVHPVNITYGIRGQIVKASKCGRPSRYGYRYCTYHIMYRQPIVPFTPKCKKIF